VAPEPGSEFDSGRKSDAREHTSKVSAVPAFVKVLCSIWINAKNDRQQAEQLRQLDERIEFLRNNPPVAKPPEMNSFTHPERRSMGWQIAPA
jgi:hypothetical protein